MTVKHEHDINWPDDASTLPADTEFVTEPIEVYWVENLMSMGGHFAVWCTTELDGAPVEDRLTKSRAKRLALKLQDKYGSPIVETVEVA